MPHPRCVPHPRRCQRGVLVVSCHRTSAPPLSPPAIGGAEDNPHFPLRLQNGAVLFC
jgi:hypothetical protein